MAYRSLRDFIARLESTGRLNRVSAPVSPYLEMTEIQTRLIAEQGPAVLFENVVGDEGARYDMPVLVNLFGTVERVAWGMNREPGQLREVGETLAFLRQPEPPSGWREAIEMLPLLNTVRAMKPRTIGAGPVQEVVLMGDDIDLGRLPIQTCWPGEPAPLITWPLVVTKGPSRSRIDNYNLGIYRMQVVGRGQDADALDCASRRCPAASALGRGEARAPAGRGGDRRRSRHDTRGGDSGAGYALGISVRGPPARPEGRACAG